LYSILTNQNWNLQFWPAKAYTWSTLVWTCYKGQSHYTMVFVGTQPSKFWTFWLGTPLSFLTPNNAQVWPHRGDSLSNFIEERLWGIGSLYYEWFFEIYGIFGNPSYGCPWIISKTISKITISFSSLTISFLS
jgi:hypothetical protein